MVCRSVRKDVGDPVTLQVHGNRAVGLSLAPTPIIDAKVPYRTIPVPHHLRLDCAKNAVPTDLDGESFQHAAPGQTAKGVAEQAHNCAEPIRAASTSFGDSR